MPSYVFQVGANYGPDGTRAEPGDILPASVAGGTITALHDAGALITTPDAATAKKVAAAVVEAYKQVSATDNTDRLTAESRVQNHLDLSDLLAPAAAPAPAPAPKKKGA